MCCLYTCAYVRCEEECKAKFLTPSLMRLAQDEGTLQSKHTQAALLQVARPVAVGCVHVHVQIYVCIDTYVCTYMDVYIYIY